MVSETRELYLDGYDHQTNLEVGSDSVYRILFKCNYPQHTRRRDVQGIPVVWAETKGIQTICWLEWFIDHPTVIGTTMITWNYWCKKPLKSIDFNNGEISIKNGTSSNALTNPATTFVETPKNQKLHQHIKDPTHHGADQQPNTLEMVTKTKDGSFY